MVTLRYSYVTSERASNRWWNRMRLRRLRADRFRGSRPFARGGRTTIRTKTATVRGPPPLLRRSCSWPSSSLTRFRGIGRPRGREKVGRTRAMHCAAQHGRPCGCRSCERWHRYSLRTITDVGFCLFFFLRGGGRRKGYLKTNICYIFTPNIK